VPSRLASTAVSIVVVVLLALTAVAGDQRVTDTTRLTAVRGPA
jgi:hypothetical protein